MKTNLLIGGSYSPPHPAHFDMAAYLHGLFKPDAVHMMFSINRLKDASKYAAIHHRMAMGQILADARPHIPFVMSDIEEKIGNNETYVVLGELKKRFPDENFIWVMGADNLLHFHKWLHAEEIIQTFPMIVIERPPYTEAARACQMAQDFSSLRRDRVEDFDAAKPGWMFVNNPGAQTMSSSDLLIKLHDPNTDIERDFPPDFVKVIRYMMLHRLYGLGEKMPPVVPKPGPLVP